MQAVNSYLLRLFGLCFALHPTRDSGQQLVIEPGSLTLPADGGFHSAFRARLASYGDLSLTEIGSNQPNLRLLQLMANQVEGQMRAPVMPQEQRLRLSFRKQTVIIPVTFGPADTDSYGDGTPDFLRLHSEEDRRAFRAWFSAIAEAKAAQPKDELPPEINDCAALLRYAYRETLHTHEAEWLLQEHLETLAVLPSVLQYQYPAYAARRFALSRDTGSIFPEDLTNGSFSQFADAKTLMQRNTYFVSRDIRVAQRGDLIFFVNSNRTRRIIQWLSLAKTQLGLCTTRDQSGKPRVR